MNGQLTLKNVYFVPDIKMNFISLSRATAAGFDVKMSNETMDVYRKDGTLVLQGYRENNLYIHKMKNQTVMGVCNKTSIQTWHEF